MSFAPGLLPRLFSKAVPAGNNIRSFRSIHTPARHFRQQTEKLRAIAIPRTLPKSSSSRTHLYTVGLGLSFLTYNAFAPGGRSSVQCQSPFSSSAQPSPVGRADDLPDGTPQSILSFSELGFGAVAGICAGVFLKKGLKALAFLLGGAFVFLQYMSSRSLVNVDWAKMSSKYDETFGTKTASGIVKAPSVKGAYNWIVDFVTANFQQRASFLAGFVLGIRLG